MMIQSKTVAFTMAFILLLVGAVFLSKDLGSGEHLASDSFYTLERSHGFQKHHDWFNVYLSNRPTPKKPPLQYWLTALGMEAGFSDLLSLRLPSYLFFLGLTLSAGFVSYLLSNRNHWTLPATILLMGSSLQLVQLSRSGLLDAGMGFFVMLALLAFFYAKENSKSWILCGLACGLGAMQKAPVAILYIAVMFFVLRKKDENYKWSSLRQNKNFNRGLYLLIFLSLFWPVLQTFRHGVDYVRIAIVKEMLRRFTPVGGERIAESNFFNWLEWLWNDLHLIGIVAVVCVILVFCRRRLRENHRLFALSIIIVVVAVAFSFATGKLFPRYLAVLSPLLICVTVVVLSNLITWRPGIFVLCALLFGIYFGCFEKTLENVNKSHRYSLLKGYVHFIDDYKNQGDYVMLDRSIVPRGAYGYFGADRDFYSGYNFKKGAPQKKFNGYLQYAKDEKKTSFIGFTRKAYKSTMEEIFGPVKVLKSSGEFMVWRSQIRTASSVISDQIRFNIVK